MSSLNQLFITADLTLLFLVRDQEAAVGLLVPSHMHSEVVWVSKDGKAQCLTDKTLVPRKPGLPKTRAYLYIHLLHLTFSMRFSEKEKKEKETSLKIFLKFSCVFFLKAEYICFFFPSGSEMKKTFFDFFFKTNSV